MRKEHRKGLGGPTWARSQFTAPLRVKASTHLGSARRCWTTTTTNGVDGGDNDEERGLISKEELASPRKTGTCPWEPFRPAWSTPPIARLDVDDDNDDDHDS